MSCALHQVLKSNCVEHQYFIFVWYVDSLDWKGISADEITRRVTSKVQPGSIVLFHNAAENTPAALPGILEYLIGQGYSVVPISQIIVKGECNQDYTIDHTGRQKAAKSATEGSAAPGASGSAENSPAASTGNT